MRIGVGSVGDDVSSRVGSVLVRVPNWLGDAILSSPALEAVRGRADRVTVMTRPHLAELYRGLADEILCAGDGLRAEVRRVRECSPDVAILLQNSFYSAVVARLGGCREVWGYATHGRRILLTRAIHSPCDIYSAHQVHYYWDLVKALGIAQGTPRLRLAADGDSPLDGGRLWIGMSPGARYGEAKRWPPEYYARAGKALATSGYGLAIFGAPGEAVECEAVAGTIGSAAVNLAGRTSIRQLLAGLARCAVLVTNDSGPLHAASALGVPVVAIFGSTEPRSSGPFEIPSIVLRRKVPCAPCHRRTCPIDHRCMRWLHPEEVVEAVVRLLGRGRVVQRRA